MNIRAIFPKSLLYRILLLFFITFIFIQGIGVYFLIGRSVSIYTKRIAVNIADITDLAHYLYYKKNFPPAEITDTIIRGYNYESRLLFNKNLGQDRDIHNVLIKDSFDTYLDQMIVYPHTIDPQGNNVYLNVQWEKGVIFQLKFSKFVLFTSTIYLVLGWLLIAPIIFFFITAFILRNQIRPLKILAKASEKFTRNPKKPLPIPVRGAREVRAAIRSFNSMTKTLAEENLKRITILQSLNSDIMKPLTDIQMQLELMDQSIVNVPIIKRNLLQLKDRLDTFLHYAEQLTEEKNTTVYLNSWFVQLINAYPKGSEHISYREFQTDIRAKIQVKNFTYAFYKMLTFMALRYEKIQLVPVRVELQKIECKLYSHQRYKHMHEIWDVDENTLSLVQHIFSDMHIHCLFYHEEDELGFQIIIPLV